MTPEQMRALADEGDERAQDILTRSPGAVHKLTDAIRAAADEMDRQGLSEHDASSVRGRYESGVTTGVALVQATNEVDRLRAAIENAPHEPDCSFRLPVTMRISEDICTCWKADAL